MVGNYEYRLDSHGLVHQYIHELHAQDSLVSLDTMIVVALMVGEATLAD